MVEGSEARHRRLFCHRIRREGGKEGGVRGEGREEGVKALKDESDLSKCHMIN